MGPTLGNKNLLFLPGIESWIIQPIASYNTVNKECVNLLLQLSVQPHTGISYRDTQNKQLRLFPASDLYTFIYLYLYLY